MVVSGRLVLLTAVGAVPVVLFGQTAESAYVTLAIWLLFVLLTRMRPLNRRRLVAWRRRWRGQPAISLEGL